MLIDPSWFWLAENQFFQRNPAAIAVTRRNGSFFQNGYYCPTPDYAVLCIIGDWVKSSHKGAGDEYRVGFRALLHGGLPVFHLFDL